MFVPLSVVLVQAGCTFPFWGTVGVLVMSMGPLFFRYVRSRLDLSSCYVLYVIHMLLETVS